MTQLHGESLIKAPSLVYNSGHWAALAPSATLSDGSKSPALTKAHVLSDAIALDSQA